MMQNIFHVSHNSQQGNMMYISSDYHTDRLIQHIINMAQNTPCVGNVPTDSMSDSKGQINANYTDFDKVLTKLQTIFYYKS